MLAPTPIQQILAATIVSSTPTPTPTSTSVPTVPVVSIPTPTQTQALIPTPSSPANPVINVSVKIEPPSPYFAGQTLTGRFTIKNKGGTTITFDELVLGGRLNGDDQCKNTGGVCSDFKKRFNLTLNAGDSYAYEETFVPILPGSYDFQVFYRIGNDWYWDLPTEPGVKNQVFLTAMKPSLVKEDRKIIVISGFRSNSACDGDNRLVDKLRWLRNRLPGYKDEDFFYFDYGAGYCPDNPATAEDESKNPNYSTLFTCVNGVVGSNSILNLLIARILQKNPTAKIDIVGHSMGGLIPTYWVATHQDDPRIKSIHSVITFDSPLQGVEEGRVSRLDMVNGILGCAGDQTAINEMYEGGTVISTIIHQPMNKVPFVTIRAIGGSCLPVLDCVRDSSATLPGVWKDLYASMGNHFELWEKPIPEAINLVVSAITTDPAR